MSSSTSTSSSRRSQPLGSFRVAGEHVQPIALPGEDDVGVQLRGLGAAGCGLLGDCHQRTPLRGSEHLVRVGGITLWIAPGEPFPQSSRRLVDLPP
jgi:hypothetical protein